MTDPVISRAIKARGRLYDVAKELRIQAKMAKGSAATLAEMDAATCGEAAELLETLGTEVTRLRLGIGCYMDGRFERHELRQMSKTWNGKAALAQTGEGGQ